MEGIIKQSKKRGDFSEKLAYEFLISRYKNVQKTSDEVNMKDHIDYTLYSDKLARIVGIDVKAPTLVDGYTDVNYATFINNRNEPGWLYGKADFAFIVTFDEFVIVELSELRKFLEDMTDGQIAVNGNPKKLYTKFHCSYGKKFRKSVSTLFSIDDVKKLPSTKAIKHDKTKELKKFYNIK